MNNVMNTTADRQLKPYLVTVRTLDGAPVASFHVSGPTRWQARLQIPAVYRYDDKLTVGMRRVFDSALERVSKERA